MNHIVSKIFTRSLIAATAALSVRLYHGCLMYDTIARIRHHNAEISKMLLDETHEHITNIASIKV